ncbi:alpha/beta fold hydrolase [Pararhizobium mangrovi]|uniref:Alpha/beta hydrolase n=1 Tax=Pararhizobium mangrovi TaxID=2590452 RepID=A0A506U4J4_9HYPH|nr:alpha/beta hydrolase [Pararhizobium mangrovi]TPW28378.1 alpha/beta hydrolase [Pararhizobium mangrovi]
MAFVKAQDGTDLYVKDWGEGRPVVLIHGWPLTADSWEHQALYLAENGYRVVAYDRRGFGRSGKPWNGYDYDTMSDDLSSVMAELDLRDAAIVGFSMGGGEVSRYMSRHGGKRVRQAALISSIAPFMGQADDNPDGVPADVLRGILDGIRNDRPAFFENFLKDFFGDGTSAGGVSAATRHWAWGMAMMASPRATLECANAFALTDLRPDMAAFEVPTLVVHGTGDQTVPIDPTGRAAAKMIASATLKEYEGAPHGLTETHKDQLNADLADFLEG